MNQTGIFRALAGAFVGSAALGALLVAVPAQGASVTINDGGACASWTWNSATSTLTCSTTTSPPAASAPTGCQPAISTQTLPSGGGTVNLSVSNCTASGAITYAWTKNGSAATTSQNWTDTLSSNSLSTAVTTTYYVNACSNNGSACTGNLPSSGLTVSVAAGSTTPPPPPPPPSGTNNLCAQYGFSKTIYYNWDWSGGQVSKLDTFSMSDMAGGVGLGTNGILVVAFTPTSPADVNNLASISVTGYPSPNMTNFLTLAISEQPCDLNPTAPAASSTSSSATVAYGIGRVPVYWSTGAKVAAELTPGRQYYINVAGRDSIGPSTPYGLQTCVPGLYYPYCEIRLGLQKPPGH